VQLRYFIKGFESELYTLSYISNRALYTILLS
jgi:hypothetical protein